MSVTFAWVDEDRKAICYRLIGKWTWDEFYRSIEASRAVWQEVNHQVDIIVDMSNSFGYPPGNTLSHFRNIALEYKNPQTGNTAVIGSNALFRRMVKVFNQIYHPYAPTGKTFYVGTLKEAVEVLANQREQSSSS